MQNHLLVLEVLADERSGESLRDSVREILRAGYWALTAHGTSLPSHIKGWTVIDLDTPDVQGSCSADEYVRVGGKLLSIALCAVREKTPTIPGADKNGR